MRCKSLVVQLKKDKSSRISGTHLNVLHAYKISSVSLTKRDQFGYAYLRVDRYAAQSAEYGLFDLRPESRNCVSNRFQRLFSTPQRAVDFRLNFHEKSTFQSEISTFCCYIKCHPTCSFQTGPTGHPPYVISKG